MATQDYFTDPVDHLTTWQLDARTKEMGIGDNGPLVDRAYNEALPFQFDREVLKNSLEAGATKVVIEPDWVDVRSSGGSRYRYVVADNGKGMTGDELVKYFNLISSSGKIMDVHGNFGVGAKVSLVPWNASGLIIMSWVEGVGRMVKIIKKANGNYALWRWDELDPEGKPTGNYSEVVDAPTEYKPDWMGESGTVIVTLGETGEEDTFLGPDNKSVIHAHALALNTRFFTIPDEAEVNVYEFVKSDKQHWPRECVLDTSRGGRFRRMRGARHFLDEHSSSSGTVQLTGAKAHWWLLEESEPRKNIHAYATEKGYVAALYDNELYNIRKGAEARTHYLQFGILSEKVWRNFTLVIEADKLQKGKLEGVQPNTPRSALLYSSGDLPWERWGQEFLAQMPSELRRACDLAMAPAEDETKEVADSLKPFLPRLRAFLRYGRNRNGSENARLNARGATRKASQGAVKDDSEKRTERPSKNAPNQQAGSTRPDGEAKVIPLNPRVDFPIILWISEANETRNVASGELEGRAAEYIPNAHTIRVNGDFILFRQVLDHWLSLYGAIPGAEERIRNIVHHVYSLELGSRVVHCRSLEGKETWSQEDFKRMTSPEALTLAVMGLVGAEHQIAPRIGGALGAAARVHKRKLAQSA